MNDQDRLNSISEAIIGAAIDVHKVLGPGLLESAYEACLAYELRQRGLKVEQQKDCPSTIDTCSWTVATGSTYLWTTASLLS